MPFTKTMSPKHPTVERDYYLNAVRLLQDGVTIVGASVTAAPTGAGGLTLGTPVIDNPKVKVRIGDGTDLVDYAVTFVLDLSNGETEVAVMIIPVRSTG